jgi:phosphatidylglycerol:prolipoprotein diacylglycerol transferase
MYALALALGGATALPYYNIGSFGPIQGFGVVVAVGVLIGAGVLRRYGEWHGASDDHIRALTGWVTVTGFIGAHLFDVLFYQWDKLQEDPLLLVKIWAGISSYGGFLGGAFGWWFYVWWKRLPMRLYADITIVGLLVAFTIGRLACTLVSDHIGAPLTDPDAWYSFVAMDYPRRLNPGDLAVDFPGTSEFIRAWNLGLLEFLYLVPVTLFILWYAFRPSKRPNAGMITVLTGVLYAPVRFFLDYLRVNSESDPRYVGLTFAQWVSIVAFGAAIALAVKIAKNGKPAEVVGRTSGEVQQKLKTILKEDEDEKGKGGGKSEKKSGKK